MSVDVEANAVLDFWFGDGLALGWPSESRGKVWWGGGPELDATIQARFGSAVRQALDGGFQDWGNDCLSRLAKVILLDQFTRNVFRSTAQAFSGDVVAQKLVMQALDLQMDAQLPCVGRVFFYMPLMHAENLRLQDECVRRFQTLHADAPVPQQKELEGQVKFAVDHRDIVARFGRFPHRNKVLGRLNTPDEDAYLKDGPRFGQ
jgi:uncharacterized protein (DUF924 family)